VRSQHYSIERAAGRSGKTLIKVETLKKRLEMRAIFFTKVRHVHGIIVQFHLDFSAFSGFVFNCFKLDKMPDVPEVELLKQW
jgi:hypothetical protein